MALDAFDPGDLIRLTATFTNSSSAAADPTTISLTIREPDGTSTTYTYAGTALTRSGTGVYYLDFTPDQSGLHQCQWASTGDPTTSEHTDFFVRAAL